MFHTLDQQPAENPFAPLRIALAALGLVALATRTPVADWPQWRGPDRCNVSAETGLLKESPKGGPPLAWKGDGLGDGRSRRPSVFHWITARTTAPRSRRDC
jgi:hypothetical protein